MTSLPKIDYPILNIKIPSLKKDVMFRPFLVKEEKLLFMAKESNNNSDIFVSIKQIVQNCCLDKNFDVDKIAIFDLEYVFLRLRAFSVDSIVKISYKDAEDDIVYDFEVNLEKIEVDFPKKVDNIVKINENVGLIMKHPSASLYSDESFLKLEKDQLFELILRCVDKVYEGDEVIDAKTVKKEELTEFIENLNVKVFEKVNEFLMKTPRIKYEIKYKNSLGNDKTIELNSLNDFFSWR
jgi:hypothetical protein